jgi:aminoglycoside phosphotransferase (APT) family kinase protein
MLADLHAQLHALPPPEGDDPSLTLVHLDLHPLNVLLCKSGPVVIDWSNSRAGRGGVDVALTAVILAQTASVDGPYVQPAAVLLDAFLEQAGPIAADDVDAAIRYRSHNPTLSSLELAVLPQVPSRLLR